MRSWAAPDADSGRLVADVSIAAETGVPAIDGFGMEAAGRTQSTTMPISEPYPTRVPARSAAHGFGTIRNSDSRSVCPGC